MSQVKKDAVYKFIVEHKVAHDGTSPSIREIGRECGIPSTSVVSYYLKVLEEDGKILLVGENAPRSIVVIGGKYIAPEGFEKVQHETR